MSDDAWTPHDRLKWAQADLRIAEYALSRAQRALDEAEAERDEARKAVDEALADARPRSLLLAPPLSEPSIQGDEREAEQG